MTRRPGGYSDYVEHPRFGRWPRLTELNPDATDGTVFCHWHSPPGVRVPDTAIAADVTKQSAATVPVTHYFDARRVCRKCERPFLFFAEEQRFWYEELGFPLEADALESAADATSVGFVPRGRSTKSSLLRRPAPRPRRCALQDARWCLSKPACLRRNSFPDCARLSSLCWPTRKDPRTPRRERLCQRSRPCHTRDDGGQLFTSSVCRSRDLSRRDAPGRRASALSERLLDGDVGAAPRRIDGCVVTAGVLFGVPSRQGALLRRGPDRISRLFLVLLAVRCLGVSGRHPRLRNARAV